MSWIQDKYLNQSEPLTFQWLTKSVMNKSKCDLSMAKYARSKTGSKFYSITISNG